MNFIGVFQALPVRATATICHPVANARLLATCQEWLGVQATPAAANGGVKSLCGIHHSEHDSTDTTRETS